VALPGISYHQVARRVGNVATSFLAVECRGYPLSSEFELEGKFFADILAGASAWI
jgi:hypothetical protein